MHTTKDIGQWRSGTCTPLWSRGSPPRTCTWKGSGGYWGRQGRKCASSLRTGMNPADRTAHSQHKRPARNRPSRLQGGSQETTGYKRKSHATCWACSFKSQKEKASCRGSTNNTQMALLGHRWARTLYPDARLALSLSVRPSPNLAPHHMLHRARKLLQETQQHSNFSRDLRGPAGLPRPAPAPQPAQDAGEEGSHEDNQIPHALRPRACLNRGFRGENGRHDMWLKSRISSALLCSSFFPSKAERLKPGRFHEKRKSIVGTTSHCTKDHDAASRVNIKCFLEHYTEDTHTSMITISW